MDSQLSKEAANLVAWYYEYKYFTEHAITINTKTTHSQISILYFRYVDDILIARRDDNLVYPNGILPPHLPLT